MGCTAAGIEAKQIQYVKQLNFCMVHVIRLCVHLGVSYTVEAGLSSPGYICLHFLTDAFKRVD